MRRAVSSSVVSLQFLASSEASLRRDALHPRLDRDASGGSEQVEHVGRPVVDAHLDAKHNVTVYERLEERLVRGKISSMK